MVNKAEDDGNIRFLRNCSVPKIKVNERGQSPHSIDNLRLSKTVYILKKSSRYY